jgi:hypothetical protein
MPAALSQRAHIVLICGDCNGALARRSELSTATVGERSARRATKEGGASKSSAHRTLQRFRLEPYRGNSFRRSTEPMPRLVLKSRPDSYRHCQVV